MSPVMPGHSAPPYALEGVDHLLLVVDDMAAAETFYREVIGCTVDGAMPEYGMVELRAGSAQLVLVDASSPAGAWARPEAGAGHNMHHLCLATSAWDPDALRAHLAAHTVEIEEEDVHGGARGESLSFYVRDPSGNLIELKGPPEA